MARTHALTVSSGTPGARFLALRQQEKVNKVVQHWKDLIIPPGDMKMEPILLFNPL